MARCKNTDMLMGAIRKAGGGKVQTSADTARKLAGEMGGMKKGGGAKKPGMAVMIAIGKPEKKKKGGMMREGISSRPVGPDGRPLTMEDLERSNRDTGGMSAAQVKASGEAIGRGNRAPYEKMPKTPKPIRRAQGGAAKVRKGMMSPSGQILQAVKPKKK